MPTETACIAFKHGYIQLMATLYLVKTETFATLKAAVLAGKTVCWKQDNYVLTNDGGMWMIVCTGNGHCSALYWADGRTTDYKAADFYVSK